MIKDEYQHPSLYPFTTKPLQATVMQTLREHTVIVHKNLVDETKHISKLLSSHLHFRSHFNFYYDFTHSYFSNSQAEITIEQYTSTPPHTHTHTTTTRLIIKTL